MTQQTKIFRLFVSSAFSDMKQERQLLQKNVFLKLAFDEELWQNFLNKTHTDNLLLFFTGSLMKC